MTPVDSAMGKAGGNSRGGQRIDVHEDTALLAAARCRSLQLGIRN